MSTPTAITPPANPKPITVNFRSVAEAAFWLTQRPRELLQLIIDTAPVRKDINV